MREPSPETVKMLEEAQGHLRAGRAEEAVRLVKQVLERGAARADVVYYLGVIAANAGRLEEGEGHLEQAVALEPRVGLFHSGLAKILAATGKGERAIVEYRKALELDANDVEACYGFGTALASQGEFG